MRREEIEFSEKDLPLREDVRTLGALVGDVLREQGGPALFAVVENARKAAIRRRSGDSHAGEALCEMLGNLEPAFAQLIVRGFSTYFQLVNLAEKVHRVRRRRDYLRENAGPQPDGIVDVMRQIGRRGAPVHEIQRFLERLRIEPVFTAHPTEATRRSILRKQQQIARRLVERMDPSMTPQEERVSAARIRASVTSTWQTEEHPRTRMTVEDELDHVTFYLTDVIYRIVPAFYENLEQALEEGYGERARAVEVPSLLRFASWVGGDMDGNPNVSAATIRMTLAEHRELILARYRKDVLSLADELSQSVHLVAVDPELLNRIEQYAGYFPVAARGIPDRHQDMPYRKILKLMAERLDATRRGREHGYGRLAELQSDVELLAGSLAANKGEHAGLFAVRRLQRRVRTFGFHLATLDVRQDSQVHRSVIGELLGESGWTDMDATRRAERLRAALRGNEPPGPAGADAERTLEVFRAIAECRERYGEDAVGPYIISMAQGADDVLSVLLLARWGGLCDGAGVVPLDVVPLLETVDDLERGPQIMDELLGDDGYRQHLAGRGTHQIVMIGYSDSNKDGGLAASRWALRRAEAALARQLRDAGVGLTLFHGRGGTISRGGGRTHAAVLGSPRGSVDGRLRVTEQGEIIDAKFGLRGIALRTLEQAVASVALVTARPGRKEPRRWHAVMDTVARASRETYRAMVYESPGFYEYFRQSTPVAVIERMQIGSRPASRRSGQGIDDLRAIPWVFAWTQSRQIVPGWFGFGSGLAAAVAEHGREVVRDTLSWAFVRGLVDDVEMVLAKVDMDIAARYAALADPSLRHFFATIRAEYELTLEILLDLKETDHLLAHDPTLRRAILLRNPYVDPMSIMQVDLLRRWRASDCADEALLAALLASVNGIAHGLQNTG